MSLNKLAFLYKTLVLEHAKAPHHFASQLPEDGQTVTLHNPTCGDTINLAAKIKEGSITDVCFNGSGCTISQASASMMTDTLNNKTLAQAQDLIAAFSTLAMGGKVSPEQEKGLQDAAVMATVAEFPTRIKCATLAWHAMGQLIQNYEKNVK